MKKIKHCIGVVSWCKSDENPDRFARLKESILSHKLLKRDDNYIFLWDNGSSEDVKEFLRSCDFYDDIYFSPKNLYTNVMEALLNLKAKELNAQYITLLAHDYLIYDHDAVLSCMDFLDKNLDCASVKMLKFEFDRMEIYDKLGNHPDKDVPHMMRLFNTVTNEPLVWEGIQYINDYRFSKNNWHWSEFPNVCRAELFDKIFPKVDCGPLQWLELVMMKNYNNLKNPRNPSLNWKTGVLDKGAALHNQVGFNTGTSSRVAFYSQLDKKILVKVSEMLSVINDVCGTKYGQL
jgi:hypothetical protein